MIDIILISGFLGAGKTTVLNNLIPQLCSIRKTVLLVNDFGKFSLDGVILRKNNIPLREIPGGSIFCICKQANLIKQLTDIAENSDAELLLIEASGLAEPTDTAALLQNSFLREKYTLPRVITIVDSLNYPKLSSILNVLKLQVKIADLLIISKIDLANPEKTEKLIKQINPNVPVIFSDKSGIYGEVKLEEGEKCEKSASLRLCSTATPGFGVVNYDGKCNFDVTAFEDLLQEYRPFLLRGKGVVNRRHFELVNGDFSYYDDLTNNEGGIFFALIEDKNIEFFNKLKELENDGF